MLVHLTFPSLTLEHVYIQWMPAVYEEIQIAIAQNNTGDKNFAYSKSQKHFSENIVVHCKMKRRV